MADAISLEDATVDCAVSTLVFHHLAPDAKVRALAEIRRVLRASGRLIIADFGRPRGPLQRIAFLYLQLLDGFENTRPHAAGGLPLIANAGFDVQVMVGCERSPGRSSCSPRGPTQFTQVTSVTSRLRVNV